MSVLFPRTSRRTVLRGSLAGATISVGLPFLDCFLNENGTALADTGKELPLVFGSWIQELGLNPGTWIPAKVGPGFENNLQLKVFDPIRDRMNIISGTKYFLDGRPLNTHNTTLQIATTGAIYQGNVSGPSADVVIGDTIGKKTRFRSLEVNFAGRRQSWSQRSGTAKNPSEFSPLALYTRIFGPEFRDPNAGDFKPDPTIMVHRSVLSSIADERQSLTKSLGAADRARMDEYFTSIRDIEGQLEISMQKPPAMPSCTAAAAPEEVKPSPLVEDSYKNGLLFAKLLAHAIACDQTRVINITTGAQGLRRPGSASTWHMHTHEEAVDEKLGYQKNVFQFTNDANKLCLNFMQELDKMREGGKSVFDRTTILWQTDHAEARIHTLDLTPIMMFGGAGGRLKTGIHVAAPSDPVTRATLTIMQAYGVPVSTWGELSNKTDRPITEILT